MTYWLLAVMSALLCFFWLRARHAERRKLQAIQEKYLGGYRQPRVSFFNHEGHQILLLDLTYCTPQEAIRSLQQFKETLLNQPAYSILTTRSIIDLTDGRFTPESIEEMKLVITENRRYFARVAFMGHSTLFWRHRLREREITLPAPALPIDHLSTGLFLQSHLGIMSSRGEDLGLVLSPVINNLIRAMKGSNNPFEKLLTVIVLAIDPGGDMYVVEPE